MNVKCLNLKGYDWNFDVDRKLRLEIRGRYCVIPEEIADKYPMYFEKVASVVIDEPKQVIEEDVQVVIDEPKQVIEEDVQVVIDEPKQVIEEDVQVVIDEPVEVLKEEPIEEVKVEEPKKSKRGRKPNK